MYDRDEDYRYDAIEAAESFRSNRGGYRCSDRMCGATDCSHCYPGGCGEEESEDEDDEDTEYLCHAFKVVTARKARFVGTPREIKSGDRVRVRSGFSYKKGGARTGYLPRWYTRIVKGPAWTKLANTAKSQA